MVEWSLHSPWRRRSLTVSVEVKAVEEGSGTDGDSGAGPCRTTEGELRQMGGAGTTEAHADASRSSVGTTAFIVAAMRAIESREGTRRPLHRDAPAEAIFSLLGGNAPLQLRVAAAAVSTPWLRSILGAVAPGWFGRVQGVWALTALRTPHIDEQLRLAYEAGASQLVVPGCGLDARAARGLSPPGGTHFELDFPGMHEEKWRIYGDVGFRKPPGVVSISADLSLGPEHWSEALLGAGYDAAKPSVWLLEGLVSYLTPPEFDALVDAVAALAAPGSTLVVTFVAATRPAGSVGAHATNPIHRFFTDDPATALAKFGRVVDVSTVGALSAKRPGAFPSVAPADASYIVATARRD